MKKIILILTLITLLFSCDLVDETPSCEINNTGDVEIVNGSTEIGSIKNLNITWADGSTSNTVLGSSKNFNSKEAGYAHIEAFWQTYATDGSITTWRYIGDLKVNQCETWKWTLYWSEYKNYGDMKWYGNTP